jgi:hypothetical protein
MSAEIVSNATDGVFVYTQIHANRDNEQFGFVVLERGANTVPRDVVRIRVDPSVTIIPAVHLPIAEIWPRWSSAEVS